MVGNASKLKLERALSAILKKGQGTVEEKEIEVEVNAVIRQVPRRIFAHVISSFSHHHRNFSIKKTWNVCVTSAPRERNLVYRGQMALRSSSPAVEQLLTTVPASRLAAWFAADAASWTAFLESVPGFSGKMQTYNATRVTGDVNVTVSTLVFWNSTEQWKSIPSSLLNATQATFVSLYGNDAQPVTILPSNPEGSGWTLYQPSDLKSAGPTTEVGCVLSSNITSFSVSAGSLLSGVGSTRQGRRMCAMYGTPQSCDTSVLTFFLVSVGVCVVLVVALLAYICTLRRRLQQLEETERLREDIHGSTTIQSESMKSSLI